MQGVACKTGRPDNFFPCLALLFATGFFIAAAITAFSGKGGFDFPIFLDAARKFIATGELYDRDNAFGPSANVYKFPPLFGALLVTGFRQGISTESFFNIAYGLHLLSFAVGIALLATTLRQPIALNQNTLKLLATGLLFFPLLDTNILCLQLDAYLFLLLSLSVFLLARQGFFWAGFFIAIAAMLKIYPVLLLPFFVIWQRPAALVGALCGAIASLIFTTLVLGLPEQQWYALHILPILLHELTTGSGAPNVSLPTVVSQLTESIYVFFHFGVSDKAGLLPLLKTGAIDGNALLSDINGIRQSIKILTSLVYAGLIIALFRIKIKTETQAEKISGADKTLCMALQFAALVAASIALLQNSWSNYQILLLIPVMLLLYGFRHLQGHYPPSLQKQTTGVIALFWIAVFVDAVQDRANHFPYQALPVTLHNFADSLPELSSITGWARCFSSVFLIYACIRLSQSRTA